MGGIIVDNKEAGNRYAISEENLNSDGSEVKVRDLLPFETVMGYIPKRLPVSEEDELAEATAYELVEYEPGEDPAQYVPTQEEIDAIVDSNTADELKAIAEELGLPVGGSKPELATRIIIAWNTPDEDGNTP